MNATAKPSETAMIDLDPIDRRVGEATDQPRHRIASDRGPQAGLGSPHSLFFGLEAWIGLKALLRLSCGVLSLSEAAVVARLGAGVAARGG